MAEELLGESRSKTTSVTVKEFTPQGVRVSFNNQGQTKGRYDSADMATVDALVKPDGTSEFEARIVDVTLEGEVILFQGKGTLKPVSPTVNRAEATGVYQTASKKLAWLNSVKARFEGTSSLPTGETVTKTFVQR